MRFAIPLEHRVLIFDSHIFYLPGQLSLASLLCIGIVSLLFCGITLKHYAYHNMSRSSQRATRAIFGILASLAENFIFIYLGLSLFTQTQLVYKPIFILVTAVCIRSSHLLSSSSLTCSLAVRRLCRPVLRRLPDLQGHQRRLPRPRRPDRRAPAQLPNDALLGGSARSSRRRSR